MSRSSHAYYAPNHANWQTLFPTSTTATLQEFKQNNRDQARQGAAIRLDPSLSAIQKGDLLFFGRRVGDGRSARVTHTGIYLGDRLFIHASERVRINSLDPASPIRDEHRIRTLIQARRVLPSESNP